eukprot:TRINITY_DN8604_c0_g1_i9.p1 TRINITY_DN8604_c0_g1~~TRINITY_DN8604_c0_g1_i9.p1  ORF type:complete len:583 (-),score=68.21 TRINITY_DN8604_c0_g1_i9:259-2007(-)
MIFETTGGWIDKLVLHTPRPYATVIASDILSSGIVQFATDFKTYNSSTSNNGLDFAFFQRKMYHTMKDSNLSDGSMQFYGDNVLALVQYLMNFTNSPPQGEWKNVYFDLLNYSFVCYSIGASFVLHVIFTCLILLGLLFTLYGLSKWRTEYKRRYFDGVHQDRSLILINLPFLGFPHPLLHLSLNFVQLLCAVGVSIGFSLLTGVTLSSYYPSSFSTLPVLGLLTFVFPSLAGFCLMFYIFELCWYYLYPRSSFNRHLQPPSIFFSRPIPFSEMILYIDSLVATQIFWFVMMVVGVHFSMYYGSAYLITLQGLATFFVLILHLFILAYYHEQETEKQEKKEFHQIKTSSPVQFLDISPISRVQWVWFIVSLVMNLIPVFFILEVLFSFLGFMVNSLPVTFTSFLIGVISTLCFVNFMPFLKISHSSGKLSIIFGSLTLLMIIILVTMFPFTSNVPWSACVMQEFNVQKNLSVVTFYDEMNLGLDFMKIVLEQVGADPISCFNRTCTVSEGIKPPNITHPYFQFQKVSNSFQIDMVAPECYMIELTSSTRVKASSTSQSPLTRPTHQPLQPYYPTSLMFWFSG